MTIPFTYCVTHKPSGKRYYGVRFKEGCHPSDLWNKYFTSSKVVKQLITEDGIDEFEIEIRRTFVDISAAKEWEHKVLRRLKVCSNDNWLNKTVGKGPSTKGFKYSEESRKKMSIRQAGRNNPMFGKTHTPEARAIISKAAKGRKLSEEHKRILSTSKKGKPFSGYNSHAPETNANRAKTKTGQKRSEEQKKNMRDAAAGRGWKKDPVTGKRIFYMKEKEHSRI